MSSRHALLFLVAVVLGLASWFLSTETQARSQADRQIAEQIESRFVVVREARGTVFGYFMVKVDGKWKPAVIQNPPTVMPVR